MPELESTFKMPFCPVVPSGLFCNSLFFEKGLHPSLWSLRPFGTFYKWAKLPNSQNEMGFMEPEPMSKLPDSQNNLGFPSQNQCLNSQTPKLLNSLNEKGFMEPELMSKLPDSQNNLGFPSQN